MTTATWGHVRRGWLETLATRFDDLVPLTTDGVFRLFAARAGDEPRVVIVRGSAGDDPGDAAAWYTRQLDEIARAHALIACRHVPQVAERDAVDGIDYVALACDASTTLESLLHWTAATRQPPMAYGAAMGLPLVIGETLQAAHRVIDPRTQAPLCLGSFGASNVLLSREGRPWIVGFGHNAAASLGPGSLAVRTGSHHAPEVGMGALPTPASDVYVVDLFFRSLLPFVDLLPLARQAIAGDPANFPADAVRLWTEQQRRLTSSQPAERFQSIDEVLRVYRGWWRYLGVVPDVEAYMRHVAGLLAKRSDATALTIARDASWFQPPGAPRVDITGRKPLQRVLRDLAGARLSTAGRARTIEDLMLAGWPGEKLVKQSGSNRVYVAIATLRQLGLGELLCKHATGYLLDPDVPLALA